MGSEPLVNELPCRGLVVAVASVAFGKATTPFPGRGEYLLRPGELLTGAVYRENIVLLALDYEKLTAGDEPGDVSHISKLHYPGNIVAFAMGQVHDALFKRRECSGRHAYGNPFINGGP